VPQQDVLPDAALVVCHGGSGTTFGALAAGVPLVFVPMFADQRPNAERVEELGAGVVVPPPIGPMAAWPGSRRLTHRACARRSRSCSADGSYASRQRPSPATWPPAPPISGLLDRLARLVS
jgi:hypothetical protein